MPVIVKANLLPNFASELQKKVDKAVGEIAKNVADTAKTLAPVKTGALRDSIYSYEVSDGEYEVTAGAEYATFVEWGTVYSAAQPFLRPAYELHKEDVPKLMTKAVRGVLGEN